MPKCGQAHLVYIDPEGYHWRLLKDLEAYFGKRCQDGEDLTEFLEDAKLRENPEMFRQGAATAKATQRDFESSAADPGALVPWTGMGVGSDGHCIPTPLSASSRTTGSTAPRAKHRYDEGVVVARARSSNGISTGLPALGGPEGPDQLQQQLHPQIQNPQHPHAFPQQLPSRLIGKFEGHSAQSKEPGPTFREDLVDVIVDNETIQEHAAVLALASPVFRRMLSGDPPPSKRRRIDLPGKTMEEFKSFMRFVRPDTARSARITSENVDHMLQWAAEFQLPALQQECEDYLLSLPVNAERLLQAHRFGLKEQYRRCVKELGAESWQQLSHGPLLDQCAVVPEVARDVIAQLARQCKRMSQGIRNLPPNYREALFGF